MDFTAVGHAWSLTFSPGLTRKSFELIFIFTVLASLLNLHFYAFSF
jgi:hypothetical protein